MALATPDWRLCRTVIFSCPYVAFKLYAVALASLVLISANVSKAPSIFNSGLSCLCTLPIVFISCVMPFNGRYCACTGTITLSAAASALMVSIPKLSAYNLSGYNHNPFSNPIDIILMSVPCSSH